MEVSKISLSEDAMHILQEKQDAKYEGSGGGGLVNVLLTFDYECANITISPELLTDGELLEELLMNAVNDAVVKVNDARSGLVAHFAKNMPQSALGEMGESLASFEKFKSFMDGIVKGDAPTLGDKCDCAVCEKASYCPVRPLKELLKVIESED